MSRTTVHLKITGFVQGVGYRYFCYREADQLGLTGWVRNCPDGSVEAEAQGTKDDLVTFIEHLRKGPGNARVEQVTENWKEDSSPYTHFEIRH